jgi:hypothetical protein
MIQCGIPRRRLGKAGRPRRCVPTPKPQSAALKLVIVLVIVIVIDTRR